VADEGQVSVQDEGDISEAHGAVLRDGLSGLIVR
jgi:hypothetical protein